MTASAMTKTDLEKADAARDAAQARLFAAVDDKRAESWVVAWAARDVAWAAAWDDARAAAQTALDAAHGAAAKAAWDDARDARDALDAALHYAWNDLLDYAWNAARASA